MVSLGYVILDGKGNRITMFIHTKEETERWQEVYKKYHPNQIIIVKEVFYND